MDWTMDWTSLAKTCFRFFRFSGKTSLHSPPGRLSMSQILSNAIPPWDQPAWPGVAS